MGDSYPTRQLSEFVAGLTFASLPGEVVAKTKELFVDWLGSVLAGKDARPVRALEAFVDRMGPSGGPCQILPSRRTTSAWCAALVNGAASHVVEQDDVHNGSVFHPAAVVFPAVVGAAQAEGRSGQDVLLAAYLARDGFTGAKRILEGPQGMARARRSACRRFPRARADGAR